MLNHSKDMKNEKKKRYAPPAIGIARVMMEDVLAQTVYAVAPAGSGFELEAWTGDSEEVELEIW
jgi:hypothetical protein